MRELDESGRAPDISGKLNHFLKGIIDGALENPARILIDYVLQPWLVLLAIAMGFGFYRGPEFLGQIGDAFGLYNALFSGVTLVGLLYTISLQRQEIRSQEEEARQNRRSLDRERREQFLTARLTATAALLQAIQSSLSFRQAFAIENSGPRREARLLMQQLAILRIEAGRGFDSEDWSRDYEYQCYVIYAHKIITDYYYRNNLEKQAYQLDNYLSNYLDFMVELHDLRYNAQINMIDNHDHMRAIADTFGQCKDQQGQAGFDKDKYCGLLQSYRTILGHQIDRMGIRKAI